jgi:hypothetical protein
MTIEGCMYLRPSLIAAEKGKLPAAAGNQSKNFLPLS